MRRSMVAISIACLCAVLVGCGTSVPEVKGKTVAQAGEVLVAAGFKAGTVTYDEKAVEVTGSIITQTPEAGAMAQAGSTVALVVAGAAPVSTPSLIGLDRAAAETALAGAGLTLGEVTESYDASAAAGVVASQTPAPSQDSIKDSSVAVVISKGSEPVAVPNVVGTTEASATALLATAGFSVSTVSKDGPKPKNTVMTQSPKAGAKAQPGSSVKLAVATGFVKVPNAWSWWGSFADSHPNLSWSEYDRQAKANMRSRLGAAGLKFAFKWTLGREGQKPSAGHRVPVGTVVTLSFAPVEDF